jgi:metal-dependent amidase/aminoacylase/carboxypeptidase family protein
MGQPVIRDLLASVPLDLSSYEDLYKYFHQNPELSNVEKETAAKVAELLSKLGVFYIHANIGGHGLAAVWENGPGKTVMLRADMDALPVEEKTGLPYASTKKMLDVNGQERPVMHACGHDMHITCLLAGEQAGIHQESL